VATNFVGEVDLQCVDWTSLHAVLEISPYEREVQIAYRLSNGSVLLIGL